MFINLSASHLAKGETPAGFELPQVTSLSYGQIVSNSIERQASYECHTWSLVTRN